MMLDLRCCIYRWDDLREIQNRHGAVSRSDSSRHVMRRERRTTTFMWQPAKTNERGPRALPRDPATILVPDESFSGGRLLLSNRSLYGCGLVFT
jgi:hypothetical protein